MNIFGIEINFRKEDAILAGAGAVAAGTLAYLNHRNAKANQKLAVETATASIKANTTTWKAFVRNAKISEEEKDRLNAAIDSTATPKAE